MANKFPTKPKRSQQFSIHSGEIITHLDLKLPQKEFKPLVLSETMLRAIERATKYVKEGIS